MSPEVKLTCEEVRGLLSEYADKELAEDEFRRIEEHLKTCKGCTLESTIILNLKRFIEVWDGLKAEEDFGKRVLDSVKSAPRGGSPLLGYLLALLGAVLVAGGIVAWAFHERSRRVHWREFGEPVAVRPRGAKPPKTPPVRAAKPTPVEEAPKVKVEPPVARVEKPKVEPPPKAEKPKPERPPIGGKPARPKETVLRGLGKVTSAGKGAAILRGGKELDAKGVVLPGDSLKGRMLVEMGDGLLVKVREGAEFSAASPGANGEIKTGCVVFDYSKTKPLAGVYRVKAGPMLVSMRKKEVVCAVERRADGSTKVSVFKDIVGLRCPGPRGKQVTFGLREGRSVTLKSDGTLVGPEPSIDKRLFE